MGLWSTFFINVFLYGGHHNLGLSTKIGFYQRKFRFYQRYFLFINKKQAIIDNSTYVDIILTSSQTSLHKKSMLPASEHAYMSLIQFRDSSSLLLPQCLSS
jgi:hypothetical protein